MNRTSHTIGLFLTNQADQQLIAADLSNAGYTVFAKIPAEATAKAWVDCSLIITDALAKPQYHDQLLDRKTRQDTLFLPLLIALPQQVDSAPWLKAGFDDVLRLPYIQADLCARVALFLRVREQSEAHAQATEQRFRALVEYISDSVTLMDARGHVIYQSPSTDRISGYSAEERLGQSVFELIHPDDQARTRERLASLLQVARSSELIQYRSLHKDGAWCWVEAIATNMLDEPSIQAIIVNIRDISERKRAEAASRTQNSFAELLQAIAVASNQAASVEQALQTAIEMICKHIGWPVGHVYLPDPQTPGGLMPTNIWHVEDPQRFDTFRKITEVVRLGPGIGLPGQVVVSRAPAWIADIILDVSTPRTQLIQDIGVRAGFALPVLFSAEVAAVLEFFAVETIEPDEALLDVMTHVGIQLGRVIERARGDASLRESEERFRALFAYSPDAIIVIDPHHPEISWPIVDCNDVACRMNGYTRDELIGQSVDLLNDIVGSRFERVEYMQRLRREGTLQFESIHRRKDGSLFSIEVVSSLISIAGRELVLGIDRDISARTQTEAALRAAEAKYRTLVEHMPAIIYTAAIDEQSTAQYVSPQIEAMLGFTPAEWLANPNLWLEQAHPDDRARMLETIGRVHTSDVPIPTEYRSYTRDGRLVWLRDMERVVRDEAGQPLFVQGITLDITDRKHAEAALAEREAYFRALIEHSADAVALFSVDGTILYGSPATPRILGYAVPEFVGRNAFDLIHPDDQLRLAEALGGIATSPNASVSVQARVLHANGSWRDLEGWLTNLLDDPAVGAIVNNYRDITERKRVEMALSESARLYRTLASNFPNGAVVLFDHDLRFTIADGAGLADIGLSRERLEGSTFWEIYPPETRLLNEPIFRAALAGTPNIREVTTGDVTLVIHMLPVRDERGAIIAGMLMSQNITERKRNEEALRMSAARFHAVWESAHDAMMLSDADGMVLEANPAYYQLYGYRPEQIIGLPYSIIFPAEQRAAAMQEYHTFFHEPQSLINVESIVHRADGTECWVESSVSFIVQDGQRTALLSLIRDITERKRMEAALIDERALLARRVDERTADLSAANADLARAARLKDEFLASMSHELRTPLNAILGLSEALQESVYGPLNDRQRQTLHHIEESGRHLLALINDILDLAKIGAGKLELMREPVAVAAVCQASLRMVKQAAHLQHLMVESSIDPAATSVYADARRLKQILVNLLSNAVKFTPVGGTIGLSVSIDTASERISFAVWDTGIGIASEHLDRLFQPFVQLDSRLARQYEGTGLGLALVARMVDMHGGILAVSSTVGVGSRFTVVLPWQRAEEEPALARDTQVPQLAESPTHRIHGALRIADAPSGSAAPIILLAEDNEATIAMIADYLPAHGYQVVVTHSGTEAIARAREVHPALILMDIQMPGIDGLEATRRIRADAVLKPIPIIALTALAMPGDDDRCIAAGANAYISKPISLKRLAATIATYLQPITHTDRTHL